MTCMGDGIFYHHSGTRLADVLDGLSSTLMVGERSYRRGGSTWLGAVPEAEESLARALGIADHPPNAAGGPRRRKGARALRRPASAALDVDSDHVVAQDF